MCMYPRGLYTLLHCNYNNDHVRNLNERDISNSGILRQARPFNLKRDNVYIPIRHETSTGTDSSQPRLSVHVQVTPTSHSNHGGIKHMYARLYGTPNGPW